MVLKCPECYDNSALEIEAYTCRKCGEGYCCHFMKSTKDAVCWVCGSEKAKEPTGFHDVDDFDKRKFI